MLESSIEFLNSLDLKGIVTDYIVEKILDKAVKKTKNIFNAHLSTVEKLSGPPPDEYETFLKTYDLSISEDIVMQHVVSNLNATSIWSKEINFNLSKRSRDLEKIFVDIDLFLSPLKHRFSIEEELETIKSSRIKKYLNKNILIYGGPGAGKTTLIKNVCNSFLTEADGKVFSCPILIRFRELDYTAYSDPERRNLFAILIDAFGIVIKYPDSKITKVFNQNIQLMKLAVIEFLEQGRILAIFDGFDEIPDMELKGLIERDFETLALALKSSKFILTSRNGDFNLSLTNTHTFEICPLNDVQILKLTHNWLNNKVEAQNLYEKIKSSPYYDTTLRPLTLSHLCAIYERRKMIPTKPRYIYDLVIQLLLELWDEQRGIVRPSAYADFYIEKKKEFLSHLAFLFTYELKLTVFRSEDIRECYRKIYKRHNLPANQAKKVVNEIESHSGIIIQNGYDSFQFSHKSLQEFLTGKYLFSMAGLPDTEIMKALPNEMAIAVALSGSPNSFFQTFLVKKTEFKDSFWSVFLSRLVEEKPDFSDDPIVLAFFLSSIHDRPHSVFLDALKTLMHVTNIKICFPGFFKKYKKQIDYMGEISYEHKELNIAVDRRGYLPGTLLVSREVNKVINSYNR